MFEDLPRGHADHATLHAFLHELIVGLQTQGHLAARGHEDHLGRSGGAVGEHIGAPGQAAGRRVPGAIDGGEGLPGEDEGNRFVPLGHEETPGFRDLVRIRGPDGDEAGNRAQ